MTRSESITRLAAALAMAQAEMPVAVFDATNPFLKSKYASLGSVIQASRPILAKQNQRLILEGARLQQAPGEGDFAKGSDRRRLQQGPHPVHQQATHL